MTHLFSTYPVTTIFGIWLFTGFLGVLVMIIPMHFSSKKDGDGLNITFRDLCFFFMLVLTGTLGLIILTCLTWDEYCSDWLDGVKLKFKRFLDKPVPGLKWFKY